ncbi:MAG: bifunctional glutamate N-acetyltransferase/amino-acid acetyltransferase ArgJ [Proteobacteria bacterium]|nr:bifunctional glutamate N-acetyltransferase/amino-acid acetyltransferase ArgJ [Pseudomonadota bacterium]MBU1420679.1 bifunctional glutamate N-acetyltransferase/amino-acid acetyltransferase ArgJ [Pseudomonadota bacterium]MBU1454596.1 bifunctional glutamate N-acetyltransferase/amino-acid acetyltransferase ArgJ [Pseudomonadota bacterium]
MNIKGFSASAVAAGIRYAGRLDLGLIYSTIPAVTAGVFTRNQVKAAPVIIDMERLKQGRAQAILVNSGCANACTGTKGMEAALATSFLLSSSLDIPDEMVLLSSTGVIGEQLNVDAFASSMGKLVAGLDEEKFEEVARAIMTTDTVPKTVCRTVTIGGHEVNFMGMAKGAGMIMPNMATMLSFVVTDAQISFPELQESLRQAADRTFNRITVDGDTSTNDMVLVMANGTASNEWIDEENLVGRQLFQETLEGVLKELALKIISDGEGATKCITIRVCGAREEAEAEQMARTVANSSLVKTAFFGEDANWGRIIAAMGRSGVRFHPDRVDIAFDNVVLVRNGLALGKEAEAAATEILKQKNISVCIDLKDGAGCEEIYTCDFSIDYVKINADYRS